MNGIEITICVILVFNFIIFLIYYKKYRDMGKEEILDTTDVYLTEEYKELLRNRNESVRD